MSELVAITQNDHSAVHLASHSSALAHPFAAPSFPVLCGMVVPVLVQSPVHISIRSTAFLSSILMRNAKVMHYCEFAAPLTTTIHRQSNPNFSLDKTSHRDGRRRRRRSISSSNSRLCRQIDSGRQVARLTAGPRYDRIHESSSIFPLPPLLCINHTLLESSCAHKSDFNTHPS